MSDFRLLAIHAHPDDESSKGAATTARYAADVAHAITAPGEAARAFLIVKSD